MQLADVALISKNRSTDHPTKSETCPSPISTIWSVPSARRATSTLKNGLGMAPARP